MAGRPEQAYTSTSALAEALQSKGVSREELSRIVTEHHQRLEFGKLKLAAGVLGISFTLLTQRGEAYNLERKRKRTRVLRLYLVVFAGLSILTCTLGIIAWRQKHSAETLSKKVQEELLRAMDAEVRAVLAQNAAEDLRALADEKENRADAATAAALQLSGELTRAKEVWSKLLTNDPRWREEQFRRTQMLDPALQEALAKLAGK